MRFVYNIMVASGGLLLAACGTTNEPTHWHDVMDGLSPQGYKRTVQISTPTPQLTQEVTEALGASAIVVVPAGTISEFQLEINPMQNPVNTVGGTPKLIGKLQKAHVPVSFTTNYHLKNTSGRTLTEGTIEALSTGKQTVYPRLAAPTGAAATMPDDARKKTASELATMLNTFVKAHDWRATVVGQMDSQHVTINAGENTGIRLGDIFHTETQPTSILKVATFENSLNTTHNKAVLKVLTGELPNVGRTLIPAPTK